MAGSTSETLTGSRRMPSRPRSGVVSGYVWRLLRERVGLTQEGMAEQFGVASDTVAGWESGRRPLTAVPSGQMLVHRHRLLRLGAEPAVVAALDRAMEADVLLASALDAPPPTAADPFGSWVMQRDLVELLAWPLGGAVPGFVAEVPRARPRRGPAPSGPELSVGELEQFFNRMRATAERATAHADFLLRRQALYLSGYDQRPDAAAWLAGQQRLDTGDGWLSGWLTERSLASVANRHGDRDRLAQFVQRQTDDDRAEAANLNYWANWLGDTGIEVGDEFMASGRLGPWRGTRLIAHLLDRLDPGHGYTDLYVHTLWALLAARPELLRPDVRARLRERLPVMLDGPEVSAAARRELDGIRYAIRLAEA